MKNMQNQGNFEVLTIEQKINTLFAGHPEVDSDLSAKPQNIWKSRPTGPLTMAFIKQKYEQYSQDLDSFERSTFSLEKVIMKKQYGKSYSY